MRRRSILYTFVVVLLFLAWPREGKTAEPLTVGLSGKYPPFNFHDSSGELVGFDVDVAQALCEDMGRECQFTIIPWDGILNALLSGKIDAIIGSMAITDERSKRVNFTRPYYESGAQLFIRSETPSPETPGFRLGVTLGTTYGEFAQKAFPRANISTYKGDVEILQDLRAGRLDGMITDRLVGLYMIQSYSAELEERGQPLFLERIAIPVRKNDEALLKALNSSIDRLRASPKYQQYFQKYFASKGSQASFSWPHAIELLIRAAWQTVKVSFIGIFLGTVAAALLAFFSMSAFAPAAYITGVLVDFIRATPFMVQLFTIYFGLPALGIKLGAWNSAVLAIALHSSAYLCEIIKTAYQSVPIGQHHAARTLGLTKGETLFRVIWPQMLPILSAPTLNTVVAMIKDSAIVSVISVHELTMQAQQLISATFRPMEFYLLAALLYFLLTYPLLLAGRALEKNFRKRGLLNA